MLSGLSARDAKERAQRSLERVKLEPEHWKKRLTMLSKGMKQRVKLAQCLLHEPRLIILDEPMNGLDPMGREDMGNALRALAKDGVTVVISSHILHDLESLCREFILLRWGRIPRASAEAASPEERKRWPASTSIRCESPEQLARFLFEQDLMRGCEILAEAKTLQVRWRDPELFYGNGRFHEILLDSGVAIYEVHATTSLLEKAIEPPPLPATRS
jgi:ABC-2 type transport system ATP-binding protein